MLKIKVLDLNEKEKADSYFKGFNTGCYNTMASIVDLKKQGKTLKEIYKMVNITYQHYLKRLEDENIDKRG